MKHAAKCSSLALVKREHQGLTETKRPSLKYEREITVDIANGVLSTGLFHYGMTYSCEEDEYFDMKWGMEKMLVRQLYRRLMAEGRGRENHYRRISVVKWSLCMA